VSPSLSSQIALGLDLGSTAVAHIRAHCCLNHFVAVARYKTFVRYTRKKGRTRCKCFGLETLNCNHSEIVSVGKAESSNSYPANAAADQV